MTNMFAKSVNRCLSGILLALCCTIAPAAGMQLEAISETHKQHLYRNFVGSRDPITIRDFTYPPVRRDILEIVLLQQILDAGGYKEGLKIIFSPNNQRMVQMVRSGKYAISANTAWIPPNDPTFSEGLIISPPLIRNGEYEAGIYALATNNKALSVSSALELQSFSFVSSKKWEVDWRALQKLGIKKLIDVPTWDMMVGLITSKRVDFVLAPFSKTDDLSYTFEEHQLLPLRNLKVGLPGIRSFTISKQHPASSTLQDAMITGMQKLRAEKRILRAFTEAGFINSQVANWKLLK